MSLKPVYTDVRPHEKIQKTTINEKMVELEILPLRDQNEIASVNSYLTNMPELLKANKINNDDSRS